MNSIIIYSTQMGTTQMAAIHVQSEIEAAGHTATIVHVSQTDIAIFNQYDVIIFTTPTYDDGQPETAFTSLLENIESSNIDSKAAIAVLALGDSSYPHFATAADVVEEKLTAAKIDLAIDSLKIDNYMFQTTDANQSISLWITKLLEHLS